MTTNHLTLTEVAPAAARRFSSAPATAMEGVVDRMRSVRLKVGRWLPSSDAMAAWSVDYAEVYGAATRLESAVRDLDAHLINAAAESDPTTTSVTLQMLLCTVEERADAFEEAVIDNLGAGR